MQASAKSENIWQRQAAKHDRVLARVEALQAKMRREPCQEHSDELHAAILVLVDTPKFPSGIDVIGVGECPIGGRGAMPFVAALEFARACFFCQFGHMTECHYPDRCAEAKCGHSRKDAA